MNANAEMRTMICVNCLKDWDERMTSVSMIKWAHRTYVCDICAEDVKWFI